MRDSHLLLQDTDSRLGRIPRDDLGIMKHVEFLGSITACIKKDGLFSSRVVREELTSKKKKKCISHNPYNVAKSE